MKGPCKLCGRTEELRRSHIISEFLYEPLYDAKHRAVAKDPTTGKEETIQKGVRENLLCGKCEGNLGKFESVAAPAIKSLVPKIQAAAIGDRVTVPVPYRELKLFTLAVLWRAGIAAGPNWQAVDLGSHEATLRSMLLSATPGAITSFPCMAVAPPDLDKLLMVITPAVAHMLHTVPVFHFMFYGIHWFYLLEPSLASLTAAPFFATHHGATVTVSGRSENEDLRSIRNILFP